MGAGGTGSPFHGQQHPRILHQENLKVGAGYETDGSVESRPAEEILKELMFETPKVSPKSLKTNNS